MRLAACLFVMLGLSACPAVNSAPCVVDTDCASDQRCRRGACGPLCLNDGECGDGQRCQGGRCERRPECALDGDCATGFTCSSGTCACTGDAACAANQTCAAGVCTARQRCRMDADCSGGTRCEVTQGLCVPRCTLPQDCAPTLDPRVATGLYACAMGTCSRRCTTDVTCGGQGVVCKDGLCATADCKTKSECPEGQYCTSATFGRCAAFTVCASNAACDRNARCERFPQNQCPPGFDCALSVCRELPRCFIDSDCVSGVPGTTQATQNGFCDEGFCQPTNRCLTSTSCLEGRACIGGVCVPPACRGHADCGASAACVDGACTPEPSPAELARLGLHPREALLVVGDVLPFALVGFRLDQSTYPLPRAAFAILDEQGQPSAAATVTAEGLVRAVAPGVVTVRATLPMSFATPASSRLRIYPAVAQGRRAVVVSAASRLPLAGVVVWACLDPDCAMPLEAVTDASGIAAFPTLGEGPATFTAVSPEVRTDAKPTYERVSITQTRAADVYVPLRDNPVGASTGFNGSVGFSQVKASGAWWLGLVATSVSDLPSMRLARLLGDPVLTQLDGVNQRVPIPGALVLFNSPVLGFTRDVKPRAFGFAQAGDRAAVAFATRGDLSQLATLRTVDLLSYVGSSEFTLQASAELSPRLDVPDTADVNGNGLCADPQRCPMGSETVPDWAGFTRLSMSPNRALGRRTEVVVPRVPSTVDTVIVAGVELDRWRGLLPTGFASKAAGAPGNDGTRPVDPLLLRTGVPFAGLETSQAGLWSIAVSTRTNAESARVFRATGSLPSRVAVQPFLPLTGAGAYSAPARRWSAPAAEWASLYASGAELGRVALVGADVRHTVYFPISVGQTGVALPRAPNGPGADPGREGAPDFEVSAVDLASTTTVDEVFSFPDVNLSTVVTVVDGYSRIDR
ncbi:MAG: hypothetical protein INH41_25045 [Myxococcaceae bacterium]|jgi:hypothetical protein|nr:hypothetical protein [Myxococcaceae bacterium]MCA3015668.1 hypothetical protein [Myxococcaceae bacterium]